MYNSSNNTSQAYLPIHRHDAQTGGLLISEGSDINALRLICPDTPAMPLSDAHFGGFFVSPLASEFLSHQKTEQGNYPFRIMGFLSHG